MKNKLSIFVCTWLLFALSACSQTYKNKDMEITIIKSKEIKLSDTIVSKPKKTFLKPGYTVYLRGAECQLTVLLDDVILFNYRGKGLDGVPNGPLPLHGILLKSGVHTLTGKAYPLYGESAMEFMSTLELTFQVQSADDFHDKEDNIFVLDFANSVPGNEDRGLEGLPYFEMSKQFYAEVPYEIEGWSKSIDLNKYDENKLKKEACDTYNTLCNMLYTRDINKLKSFYKDFLNTREIAFYMKDEDKEQEWNNIVKVVTNKDYVLQPLPQKAIMRISANGKLMTLLDEYDNSIIRFVNKNNEKDIITMDFKFHKKTKNSPFELI